MPFPYDTLDDDPGRPQTRLLELHPGLPQDQIHCTLRTVTLNEAPKYEGLSYCWGDAKITSLITYFWIDAVCINQTGTTERNHQVAMMRDIYSSASQTIVCLGPETDGSRQALGLVPDLLAVRAKFHGPGKGDFPTRVPSVGTLSFEEVVAIPELSRLVRNIQARTSFGQLFGRPWFSRVWVIQEVSVSFRTTVACGSVELDFDDLAQAYMTFMSLGLHLYTDVNSVRSQDILYSIWDTRRKKSY
ncbi:heterokaryon incompatibility protein-domain-containing protein [Podospora didyma]|uniref:Heterokaryon incompatibility protein-domain-containing protein n=1 Tax=Podospora didyma TaxID=330526 RepID=A0AAE0NUD3_9PEZI|nr:heterokaryon incompatibility protein-domain-containing protein [Podospora didyma]